MLHMACKLTFIGVVVCLACCTNLRAPAQTNPQAGTSVEQWRLKFHLSGGFAGYDRTLEMDNTGNATATDRKLGTRKVKATEKELATLSTLLEGLRPTSGGRDAGCRDCIEYSLDVQMRGRSTSLRFNDNGIQDSKLGDLVQSLTSLVDRALANN